MSTLKIDRTKLLPPNLRKDLAEAISIYTVRAASKLRQQESASAALRIYIRTNPFQPDKPQYHAAQTVTLSHPSQDTRILIQAALTGLKSTYRPQFSYAKAGVHLLGDQFHAQASRQTSLPPANRMSVQGAL